MIFMHSIVVVIASLAAAPPAPQADSSPYVWAAACKECHQTIYESWAKTKHEHALLRLNASEQEGECVQCHVTGAKARLIVEEKVVNGGIQCESCHGPGKAHVAEPTKKGLVRRVPDEATCTACHSSRSPHFNFFNYGALAPLVHAR